MVFVSSEQEKPVFHNKINKLQTVLDFVLSSVLLIIMQSLYSLKVGVTFHSCKITVCFSLAFCMFRYCVHIASQCQHSHKPCICISQTFDNSES